MKVTLTKEIKEELKVLADFGEALKKDCPRNDCMFYRDIYERYCEEYTDYKRIIENFADWSLSESTIRALKQAILEDKKELYNMWFNNYAVLEQRVALGETAIKSDIKRKFNL